MVRETLNSRATSATETFFEPSFVIATAIAIRSSTGTTLLPTTTTVAANVCQVFTVR